ncbi:MAG: zinc-ribbon domain-containing protein [Candidatus Helarchaeota archaeon]
MVLFTEGHGEVFYRKKSIIHNLLMMGTRSPFYPLNVILLRYDYAVKFSEKKLSLNMLRDFDILVIFNPTKMFHRSEVLAVEKFVYRGGSLLLVGRPKYPILSSLARFAPKAIGRSMRDVHKPLNFLSTHFGIIFIPNQIRPKPASYWNQSLGIEPSMDEVYDHLAYAKQDQLIFGRIARISNFIPHPIFKNVKSFYYQGCSLEITKNALPLAFTDSYTIPPKAVVMGTNIYGDGRVLAIGSSLFFFKHLLKEISIQNPQHSQLILNIFSWLSQKAPEESLQPVKLPPREKICPFCGEKNSSSAPFCNSCGSSI